MDKEKEVTRLTEYLNETKERLLSPVPAKHKIREREFRNFLRKEIKFTTDKLNALKTGV